MRERAILWIFLIAAIFLCCGCTPWVRIEQAEQNDSILLGSGRTLGQTFTAHENGLQSIAVHLTPVEVGQGDLQLVLTENPVKNTEVISATIPVSRISQPGWYHINFPAIQSSSDKDYYADFSLTGSGKVALATGPADSYLDGSLYWNEQPVEAQAVFQLSYDTRMALAGLAKEGQAWTLYLLATFWLFVLPGLGLLSILYRKWSQHAWIEKITLAAGFSLALYPLLFLWTGLVRARLGVAYAWLPGIIGAALIVFNQVKRFRSGSFSARISYRRENLLPDVMLVIVLIVLVFSRLWVIRELDYPMWGDSYQHSVIARLLVDNGGLFNSWLPYAELRTFTYHFGFHTLVAVFHWLTGLPIPAATLWTGQIVNILAIIALIPLANRLGRSRWAGVVAILVAGLLSPMPQAYLNWGRYTQLAGQAILPVAVALSYAYFDEHTTDRRLVAVLALALGGLALTHYRIIIFAALFYVAYFLIKARSDGGRSLVLKITWIGLGAFLLCLPWMIRLFEGGIPAIAAAQLSTPISQLSAFDKQYNSIGDLGSYLSPVLWALMLLSVAWSLWRREKEAVVFCLWWFLILIAANPQWFNVPGSGIISNFAVFIAGYIPAGILIGAASGWFVGLKLGKTNSQKHLNLGLQVILAFMIFFTGYYGIRARLKDENLVGHVLFTRADQRAAQWIDTNLPEKARLLVNSFFAYGNGLIVGSDGGWWLPLTAHRQTSLPPLNYGNEKGPTQDYRQQVNALLSDILAKGIDHPDVLNAFQERGIKYIYIGQRQGQVNNPSAKLDLNQLLSSNKFKLIYHQDRVYIFEVLG